MGTIMGHLKSTHEPYWVVQARGHPADPADRFGPAVYGIMLKHRDHSPELLRAATMLRLKFSGVMLDSRLERV